MIFNAKLHLLFAVQAYLNKVNKTGIAKRKLIISTPKDINLFATFTYSIKINICFVRLFIVFALSKIAQKIYSFLTNLKINFYYEYL